MYLEKSKLSIMIQQNSTFLLFAEIGNRTYNL